MGEGPGHAIGAASPVGVDLVEDAELARPLRPEALDEPCHLLAIRRADVEDPVDVGRLALRLGPREVADHHDVAVALDEGEGARQGGRAHVVREEEDLLLLHEVDGVPHARLGLITVVERGDHELPAVDAAPRVDLRVVRGRAAPELGAETRRRALEGRRHADLDVARAHAGRAGLGWLGPRRDRASAGPRRCGLGEGAPASAEEGAGGNEAARGQAEKAPPVHHVSSHPRGR